MQRSLKSISGRRLLLAGVTAVLGSSSCFGGDLLGLLGHRSGCGCSQPAPQVVHVAPMIQHTEVVEMAPVMESACACSAAIPSCCGIGGGLVQLGSMYGFSGSYGGISHGGPAPGSFLSGYEGIPNMDGGGIHHRYPYHSYRRPWAHPGTPSTNVTIVW